MIRRQATGLAVLGVTGSIGRQTLEVAADLGISPTSLAAGTGSGDFAAIAARHPDAALAVADPHDASDLRRTFGARIEFGPDAVTALAAESDTLVMNGIVGFAGLDATLAALGAGNRLGLANKESLVAAGDLVMDAVGSAGELIPVDSEHSAIFQCLVGEPVERVRRLVLTASGGPFRGRDAASLADVTPAEALAHPTWRMGERISIDSATLVNKGLEVIEAHHLFGLDPSRIDVLVHPGSVVHSLVEFTDGSLKAHLGDADMRIPIAYAVTHPDRSERVSDFSLAGRSLVFEEPDRVTFPALDLAYGAIRVGGGAPAALNAADEVAVEAFLAGRLPFPGIAAVIEQVLAAVGGPPVGSVDEVKAVDAEARRLAVGFVG